MLNVGAGKAPIEGAISIDLPEYHADVGLFNYPDGSVGGIHAYHFLEHVARPIDVLKDFQRVLVPGGIISIGVPHACSQMAFNDLDHRFFFTEKTFPYLFDSPYYSKNTKGWKLRLVEQFIMGIESQYLMLFVILRKTE